LHVAPIVQSAYAGDRGVIDDGTYLEAKLLNGGEFRPKLARQHHVRPIDLAEAANRFRFDFPVSQLAHIGTLGKAENELRIDIPRARRRGRQDKQEH
jgi:hypothetical protein